MTRLSCLAACLALAAGAAPAHAEHARIDLELIHVNPDTGADGDAVTANADREPPAGGLNDRPLAEVKAGEPLALQFILDNTYPHGILKDVTVRYYLTREDTPGRTSLPDPKGGTVTDGRFTMNFKPKCRVGARVALRLTAPGYYLLRVETQNTDSDHEHFAAIDVKVEAAP